MSDEHPEATGPDPVDGDHPGAPPGSEEDVGADTAQFRAFVERPSEPVGDGSPTAFRVVAALSAVLVAALILWLLLR